MVLGGLLIASLYTSFRPLTGMVHRKDGTYDGNVSFRPLAGIVQKGGVTDGAYQYVFAPLRGSYYHMLSMPSANCVFAPLRGLYLFFSDYGWNSVVFVPLRGLYPKYITKHRKTEEPDG